MNKTNQFLQNMLQVGRNHGISESDYSTISSIGLLLNGMARIYEMAEYGTYDAYKELFPITAQRRDSLLKHGRIADVYDQLATPATINIEMSILLEDLVMKVPPVDGTRKFVIDKNSIINVSEYQFTLDYDIEILIYKNTSEKLKNLGEYSVVADYKIDKLNPISNITHSYIPVSDSLINGDRYITLSLTVRQYKRVYKEYRYIDDLSSANISFTFDNHMADFNVYYQDTFDGAKTLLDKTLFFDSVSNKAPTIFYKNIKDGQIMLMNRYKYGNFFPKVNSLFTVEIFETDGKKGNFTYLGDDVSFNFVSTVDMVVDVVIRVSSESAGGSDEKSIEDLRQEIIKKIRSRETIMTEEDLSDEYNLLKNDMTSFFVKKVRDDFARRIFFIYSSVKTADKKIIPTNTLNLAITDDSWHKVDRHYLIPEGTVINCKSPLYGFIHDLKPVLTNQNTLMEVGTLGKVSSQKLVKSHQEKKFEYYIPYSIDYDTEANIALVYESRVDRVYTPDMVYNNKLSPLTLIPSQVRYKKEFMSNDYSISFKCRTNLLENADLLYTRNPETGLPEDNGFVKIKLMLISNKVTIGYLDVEMKAVEEKDGVTYYTYEARINSDMIISNRQLTIKANNIASGEAGSVSCAIGNIDVHMIILQNGLEADDLSGQSIPQLPNYKVSNIYTLKGTELFRDYTYLTNVQVDEFEVGTTVLSRVPLIGKSFVDDGRYVEEYFNQLDRELTHLGSIYRRTEQNYSINLTNVNTYGFANIYRIGIGNQLLDSVNIKLKFLIRLKDKTDLTVNDVKKYISDYFAGIDFVNYARFHYSDLDKAIRNDLTGLDLIQFIGINDYDYTYQLIQSTDPEVIENYAVPEIVNIEQTWGEKEIVPLIEIELVD